MSSRSSIRDQIALKRAEVRQNTPQKAAPARPTATPSNGSRFGAIGLGQAGGVDQNVVEDKTLDGQLKKAVRSGKLDISSLPLHRIPAEVYMDLLGIPEDDLSNPRGPAGPSTGNAQHTQDKDKRTFSSQLRFASEDGLSAEEEMQRVFGGKNVAAVKAQRERVWVEPEETTLFRAWGCGVREIEREFGAFGGLKSVDLHSNKLSSLPDSFADLLRITILDLSDNDFTSLPPALLLLPLLQTLDLSQNAISSLDFSSPIPPSDEGLSYGAGFLSTSISRTDANKGPRPVWPQLRSLDLGRNKLSNDALGGFRTVAKLGLRAVVLERNEFDGILDVDAAGLGVDSIPELASLDLSGNVFLRETRGTLAKGAKVEMVGCNVRDAPLSKATSSRAADSALKSTTSPAALSSPSQRSPNPNITHVYRTLPAASFDAEPLDVDFDLYLPPAPGRDTGHPLLIWFHGGGLLQGNKENLPPHFRRLPRHAYPSSSGEEHVAVISPNYRLAPQVPVLDILSDITALLAYVRTKLNDRLAKEGHGEHKIDTGRICLSGGSAGGYLALICGLPVPVEARDEDVGGYRGELGADGSGIRCLAPFYPITDLTDPFWATETKPVPWRDTSVTHAQAKPHIDLKAAPVASALSGGPRSILYPYMLQHGLFPSLLFRKQKAVGRGLDGFRPEPLALSISHRLDLLAKGRSGGTRPPIYLVYGTEDNAVQPFERSVAALQRTKGELKIEVREGAGHGFDEDEGEECEEFRDWLGRHLI